MTLDRSTPPSPGPYRELRLPTFRRFELDSGLQIYVAERRQLPEVSMQLIMEGGAALDEPDRCGEASLTVRMLSEGARDHDADQMAEWLDELGAGWQASVDYDVARITVHSLSEVLDGALDYLAAAVTSPTFSPKEVERVRQERLDQLLRQRDDAGYVAAEALIASVYGDHPYGRPTSGEVDTVPSLGAEQLRRFHESRLTPRGATLVACGDLVAESFVAEVERRLGRWAGSAGGQPTPRELDTRSTTETPDVARQAGRVRLIDRPGSAQAELRIGAVGLSSGASDEFAATVANAILGGLFNSRINMNLREDKGWTYGARTSFAFRRGRGPFVGRTAVESSVAAAALNEMLAEIESMKLRPPTDSEIRLAKNALTLSLPRQFETSGQVTAKLARQVTYDLAPDYWETYRTRIESVRRDDVIAAVEKYLPRERLVLLVAGDAEGLGSSLDSLGPVDVESRP